MPEIDISSPEAIPDAIALTLAVLRGDEDGQAVILDNCSLRDTAKALASIAAGMVAAAAAGGTNADDPQRELTPEQLQAAEAMLMMGIQADGELGEF